MSITTVLFISYLFISFLSETTGQWLNFGGNAQRQSRSNATGVPNSYYSWTLEGTDNSTSPVIGSDGTLYVLLTNGSVCALNGTNGQSKWIITGIAYTPTTGLALSPNEQTLFVPSNTTLIAIDTNTGNKQWNFSAEYPIHSNPVVGLDGTVYFGSEAGNLYALDSTGSPKWNYTYIYNVTYGPFWGSATLGLNGRVLQLGMYNEFICSFYADNGTLDWCRELEVPVSRIVKLTIGNLAVSDDGTIFGAYSTELFVFAPNGTILQPFLPFLGVGSSPSIGRNGYIYIGTNSAFWCIHPNGTLLWEYPISQVYSTASVAYDGSVFVGGYNGPFSCLNGTTGEVKWSIEMSGLKASAAIGPDGSLYITAGNQTLYAFLGTI
jgi:outer membrane protein assembly factor BamB